MPQFLNAVTTHNRYWICLCCAWMLAATDCMALPKHEPVPGGLAIITISTASLPKAYFNGRRVLVTGESGNWQAVLGIPLDTKPGEHYLQITTASVNKRYAFIVRDKQYQTQHITIKNKRMVHQNAADLARIRQEAQHIKQLKAAWTTTHTPSLSFIPPVTGPYSSLFGLRRFFNGEPRRPHSGLDIAAPEGTIVHASAAGTVTHTGDFFFNGNTVFIDHGQGLLTMYCHLQQIAVTNGEHLAQGAPIGRVGKTGRATGAHLHWSVIINKTAVDPLLFLPTLSSAMAGDLNP